MVAALVRTRCSVTSVTVYSLHARAPVPGEEDLVGRVGIDGARRRGVEVGPRSSSTASSATCVRRACRVHPGRRGEREGRAGGLGGQRERGPLDVRQARPLGQFDLGGEPVRGEPGQGAGAHSLGDGRIEAGDSGDSANPEQGAAVGQGDRGGAAPRLDPGVELTPAAGVEAGGWGIARAIRALERDQVRTPGRRQERERRGRGG